MNIFWDFFFDIFLVFELLPRKIIFFAKFWRKISEMVVFLNSSQNVKLISDLLKISKILILTVIPNV